eukprot:5754206-Pleurochrysis_carterae.AAC.4
MSAPRRARRKAGRGFAYTSARRRCPPFSVRPPRARAALTSSRAPARNSKPTVLAALTSSRIFNPAQ